MSKPPRTLQELAKEALQVQNASNLSGVLHAFTRALKDLRVHCPSGSDELHQHPITKLWADKISSLAKTQTGSLVGPYNRVMDLAAGKEAVCQSS
jgi:hypothetical protein